ncbi:hypothetical protein OESDEN_19116 [Oesophagostomum dentatum]|uniref:Uncharacterized protein n=1 Tax=Oesophagostomum dentatum TaxID=61180 RepID=A0A0B1S7D7_OESDE|nr:hypothetical protein OESDEN_19116 [Oesophagostomum dentatum]
MGSIRYSQQWRRFSLPKLRAGSAGEIGCRKSQAHLPRRTYNRCCRRFYHLSLLFWALHGRAEV